MKTLIEARCIKCNRLLAKVHGIAEIRCKKCHKINLINTLEAQ